VEKQFSEDCSCHRTVFKIVCAWCGKEIGEKDGHGQEGITHGICAKCLKKWKDSSVPSLLRRVV